MIADTPSPPYVAVIFTSTRMQGDNGYTQMADQIEAAAKEQPGYLGLESARDKDGLGITVSYWWSLEDVRDWKAHARHKEAQQQGRSTWYEKYSVRVCIVEREYSFGCG